MCKSPNFQIEFWKLATRPIFRVKFWKQATHPIRSINIHFSHTFTRAAHLQLFAKSFVSLPLHIQTTYKCRSPLDLCQFYKAYQYIWSNLRKEFGRPWRIERSGVNGLFTLLVNIVNTTMWRGKENRGLGLIVVFQYQQYYSHNNNIFRINKPIATLMSKVFTSPPPHQWQKKIRLSAQFVPWLK